ncbi:hypothetical protein V7S43_015230 [Phytophthora oleae]|uniref:AAA+ ATPase domain-containing protein n=1 Tax=Phytophthora oleae TaxID=2107226 RepID=A0ABD3F4A3_9STRA
MASAQNSNVMNPERMAEFLNAEIYKQVQAKSGKGMEFTEAEVVDAEEMKDYSGASKLQDEVIKRSITALMVKGIRYVYPIAQERTVALDIAGTAVNNLITQLGLQESPSHVQTQTEIEQLKYAFTKTKYVGNAHVRFAQYLRRCYKAYKPKKFKAPYVEVVQSSGFGKSRMIRELAVKAKDDKELNMKVLYTCIRVRNSTGYPKATPVLSRWLLEIEPTIQGIAKRLKAIFHYATEHWGTVQTQWLELFTDTATAAAVTEALEKTLKRQEAKATEKLALNKEKPSDKLVLVVIDEARNLINNTTSGLDLFHMLQRALVLANNDIGEEGRIFGVLVDTNPRITIPDPSQGRPVLSWLLLHQKPVIVPTFCVDSHYGRVLAAVLPRSTGRG